MIQYIQSALKVIAYTGYNWFQPIFRSKTKWWLLSRISIEYL